VKQSKAAPLAKVGTALEIQITEEMVVVEEVKEAKATTKVTTTIRAHLNMKVVIQMKMDAIKFRNSDHILTSNAIRVENGATIKVNARPSFNNN
jgi:hypothetical protein